MMLHRSNVKFLETPHEYWLGFDQLVGVTTMLKAMLPEQYKDVPQSVLMKAAEQGTRLHKLIECLFDKEASQEMQEEAKNDHRVQACLQMFADNGLSHIENEYLVSDDKHIASSIDFVGKRARSRNKVVLGDYKTTSTYHKESVTYQLNVYRVLFERMNPEIKVEKLVCFWLPKERYGSPQYIEVDFLPDNVIWDMIDCFINHKDWTTYIPIDQQNLPANVVNAQGAILSLLLKRKELEEQVAKIKEYEDKLREAMEEYNVKSWDAEGFKATRVDATTRKSFDKDKAKSEDPDGYQNYVEFTQRYQKETPIKGTIKFTLKSN